MNASEPVPFNRDLTDDERNWRLRTFHKQYHDTVTTILTQRWSEVRTLGVDP